MTAKTYFFKFQKFGSPVNGKSVHTRVVLVDSVCVCVCVCGGEFCPCVCRFPTLRRRPLGSLVRTGMPGLRVSFQAASEIVKDGRESI